MNLYFDRHCPSVADYNKYLQSKGSRDFMTTFEEHLSECELCRTAIEGYKQSGIDNTTRVNIFLKSSLSGRKHISRTLLKYAASVVVLFGVSIYFVMNNYRQNAPSFDYSLLYNNSDVKFLSKKQSDCYISINSCNSVSYNDRIMTIDELLKQVSRGVQDGIIRVEVGSVDYQCADSIVNLIKDNQNSPVLTIKDIYK